MGFLFNPCPPVTCTATVLGLIPATSTGHLLTPGHGAVTQSLGLTLMLNECGHMCVHTLSSTQSSFTTVPHLLYLTTVSLCTPATHPPSSLLNFSLSPNMLHNFNSFSNFFLLSNMHSKFLYGFS